MLSLKEDWIDKVSLTIKKKHWRNEDRNKFGKLRIITKRNYSLLQIIKESNYSWQLFFPRIRAKTIKAYKVMVASIASRVILRKQNINLAKT